MRGRLAGSIRFAVLLASIGSVQSLQPSSVAAWPAVARLMGKTTSAHRLCRGHGQLAACHAAKQPASGRSADGSAKSAPPNPFLQPALAHLRLALAAAASVAVPCVAAAAGGSGAPQDSLVQGMIAGAVAGAAVDLVLYPIDTIKTRLQTGSMKDLDLESLPELYSGLIGSLAGHIPSSALFFAIYQTSKVYWLEPSFGQGAVAAQLLASALGNIGASTIRVPTEVVKTRLQSGGEETVGKCCQKILAQVSISFRCSAFLHPRGCQLAHAVPLAPDARQEAA
jgi:hypothetical protein